MDYFASRIVLRPQEISITGNHPSSGRHRSERRPEFDIYGHANSTHVAGVDLMNGIGGSGDFERNAYLSIFMAPSIAKEGKISTVVPMCSHVDHSEHSVKVIITEQGIADLRGLSRFNAPALSLIIVHILCIGIICIAIWKMRTADIFTTILATSSTYTVI